MTEHNEERQKGAAASQPIRAHFVVEESKAEDFVRSVKETGGKVEGEVEPFEVPPEEIDDYADGQFEPLMVVAVSVSVAYLVSTISKLWLDHTRPGGTIVDARGGRLETRVAPHVERNKLIVLTDKKVLEFNPAQKAEGADLLQALANRNA